MMGKLGLATVLAGTLDLVANFVLWGLWKGISPLHICQAVATGFYGKAAFDGGWVTGGIGLVTEYVLIFAMAAGYEAVIRLSPPARRHWGWTVVVYGLALYVVMNYAVVPMSAAGRPYPWPIVWDIKLAFNVFCHIALVALPFGLVLRGPAPVSAQAAAA